MHSLIYLKLAWSTMFKNKRLYFPFILGSSVMVMTLYCFVSLQESSTATDYFGAYFMNIMLGFGVWIILLFSIFFYFYLNGFLMKGRKQEQGLFAVLGLEKRHLILIMFYQLLFTAAVSIFLGLLAGILLSKILLLFLAWLIRAEVPLGLEISSKGIMQVSLITLGEYALIFAWSCFAVLKSKPVDLMQDEAGEKEPKNRWLISLAGLICLIAGYWMALSVKDPMNAFTLFFVAVVFVIIGTYLLFLAGSITLLNMLSKNKKYYYQTVHFLNLSIMKYRMKANAAALANICILSAMILVAVSTTSALYAGAESSGRKMYPTDEIIQVRADLSQMSEVLNNYQKLSDQSGISDYNESISAWVPMEFDGTSLYYSDGLTTAKDEAITLHASIFLPANAGQLTDEVLKENEIAVYCSNPDVFQKGQTLTIGDREFVVKEINPKSADQWMLDAGSVLITNNQPATLILPDQEAFALISPYADIRAFFNTPGTDAETIQSEIDSVFAGTEFQPQVFVQSSSIHEIISLYASFLFIGLFVSLVILTILILVMYYKQISEGNQDRDRFAILQNIGLEPKKIRKLISSQAMWMFFLPLIAAVIHLVFASNMIIKILNGFLGNSALKVYIITGIVCICIFVLIYILVYRLTSNVYYSLVARKD